MSQRFRRRQWLRNLFFIAAAGVLGVLAFGERGGERLVLTALEAQEAAALCAKEGAALPDFWARAEAMGLGGVIVREESLKELAQRGRLLMFSRDEVEKWRAAGLVSPAVPIKPSTLWIKDQGVLEQVLQAAARYGVPATTSTTSGYRLVHFPEALAAGGSLDETAIGVYDPDVMKSLEGRRLARVFVPLGAPQGLNESFAINWRSGGVIEGVPGPFQGIHGALLDARELPVDAALPRLLKAVYSHPARLLALRLTAQGVERNFERLRPVLQEFKRRGLPLGLPEKAPAAKPPPELLRQRLVELLLWLFGISGPLLAARAGLVVLKRTRVLAMAHWPVAAPVLQLLAGIAASGISAVLVGLAARACFDSLGFAPLSWGWARASLVTPLLIGLLTLYTIDLEEWRRKVASPMRWIQCIGLAAAVGAAVGLIEPRRLLSALHLSPWAGLLLRARVLPWWWDWRWREVLVGWPCLFQAFFLINWRMDCPDCATLESHSLRDPRLFFLLGLLAPIGIVVSVGLELAPRDVALAQTGWSALSGLVLGAALIALRLRWLHGTKDPEHHRTIDLDVPA